MNTLKFKDSEKDALMWLLWKGMEITKSNKKYDIFDRLYNKVSKTESERQKSTKTNVQQSILIADKFIKKVETGMARSKETYKDLKEIKEEAELLKKQLGL